MSSRNYEADQLNELEALESIYYNEFEILEKEPRKKFKILITTENYEEVQDGLTCSLVITFPIKYPDEEPIIEFEDENFEVDTQHKLMENLKEMIQENLGMEMVFSLVAGTQEKMNVLFDESKLRREEEKLKKEKELEELERKRFEGTCVTVETFMNWRNEFEAEMGITEKKIKESEANLKKLTGRELFLRDQSLLDSDIRFLQQNGDSIENVKIDESLFSNLELDEELPSDDDESDDPDYVPA